MRFKENVIKPGMVIHCPKEEDARVLIGYLRSLGYSRNHEGSEFGADMYCRIVNSYIMDISYGWNNPSYRDKFNCTITEFSDLIELKELKAIKDSPINSDTDSPMSAAEVLEWFAETEQGEQRKVFDGLFEFDDILNAYGVHDIIAKITAYEATKKAPKPVDVEWVDFYGIFDREGHLKEYYDNLTKTEFEKEFRKYIEEHRNGYHAKVERQCRVKEDGVSE